MAHICAMMESTPLVAWAADYGIVIDDKALRRLDRYAVLLLEWNQKMNLTAIVQPQEIALKHFVDSLTLLPYLPSGPFSLIDVGTGAGFPGLVLAILRPDIELTLLDSLQKRLTFLQAVCEDLGLKARRIHARAEEAGQNPTLREHFDMATARAVAALPTLCEFCLPFVRVGGRFIAMKGSGEEADQAAERAIRTLGGSEARTVSLRLPNRNVPEAAARTLFLIDKRRGTPSNYPRPFAKISKQPW